MEMEIEKLEKLLKKIDSKEISPSEELVTRTKERVLRELDLMDDSKRESPGKRVVYNKPRFRFAQLLAVVSCFALLIILYMQRSIFNKEIYAYVHIDINPSIEMTIDLNNIVTKVVAINDSSKEFLKDLKLNQKSLDRAVEDILEKSVELALINEESNNVIICAHLAETYSNEKKEVQNLNRILDNLKVLTSNYRDIKINAHTLMVPSEVFNKAKENNVSMSRYVLFKELEKRGFEYSIEDIKTEDVSYMLGKLTQRPEDDTKEDIKPKAAFTYTPEEITIGDVVKFDATDSEALQGSISQYSWDFGDGANGVGKTVEHRYTEVGNYLVKLSVTNNLGVTGTYTEKITVKLNSSNKTKFDWENGSTEGFIVSSDSSSISNTTEKSYEGTRSLKWDIAASGEEILEVCRDLYDIIPAGSTITFKIWVPLGAPVRAIQPYIMTFEGNYENYRWYSSWQRYGSLKKDAWNEFVIKLPEDLDMTLEQQIGVQCEIIGEGNFTIYIDLIEW